MVALPLNETLNQWRQLDIRSWKQLKYKLYFTAKEILTILICLHLELKVGIEVQFWYYKRAGPVNEIRLINANE